jgi:hypothetical protein
MDINQNAKFAFVIAEGTDLAVPEKLRQMLEYNARLEQATRLLEETITIHNNVWLIPLPDGLPFLGEMMKLANSSGVRLRILFVQSEPDWMKYPPFAVMD